MKVKGVFLFILVILSFVGNKAHTQEVTTGFYWSSEYCIVHEFDPLLEDYYKEMNVKICYQYFPENKSIVERCVVNLETESNDCELVSASELKDGFTSDFFKELYMQTHNPVMELLSELAQSDNRLPRVSLVEILQSMSHQSAQIISSDSIEYIFPYEEEYITDDFHIYEDEEFQDLKEEINGTTQVLLAGIELGGGIIMYDLASRLEKHLLSPTFVKKIVFVNPESGLISRTRARGTQFARNLLSVKNVRRVRGLAIFYALASPATRAWGVFFKKENPGLVPLIPLTRDFILEEKDNK